MPLPKTQLAFNPDTMTVSDLKKCANTLRSLIQAHDQDPDNWEELGRQVAQYADAYEVV